MDITSLNSLYPRNTLDTQEQANIIYYSDDVVHTKYISFFIFEAMLFILLGYYLCYKAKNHIKPLRQNAESMAMQSKYQVFYYLSIANISRGVSIIYIFLCLNRTDDDFVSFINYICHVIPTIMYISVFLRYIRFIIEKYYEIKINKKDIFLSPSLNFFHILIFITFSAITFACLSINSLVYLVLQEFKNYMYICLGLTSILLILIAWFYLYFGIKLANYYSESRKDIDSIEKVFIRNKVLFVSVIFGVVFITRGVLSFLTCVDVFGDVYPSFLNINLWDNIVFFISELVCSCIIGYTRQREDRRNIDREIKTSLPNINNEILGGNIMEEFNNIHEPLMYHVQQKN